MKRLTAAFIWCLLVAFPAAAQATIGHVPSTADCVALNQTVISQIANGQIARAEATLDTTLGSADRADPSCRGVILNNMASVLATAGRIADAERFAARSLKVLDTIYAPDDPVLLRPLQVLADTRFVQGKMAPAREAFQRMQMIRVDRPEDGALVHGMAAAFLQRQGKHKEAEAEYLAALQASDEAGLGAGADAAAIVEALGSLYIKEHRFDEARRILDRAQSIVDHANDAVPLDRVKHLELRGVLAAWQGDWRQAEPELSAAVAIADRQPQFDRYTLRSVLTTYAFVLRKNHRGREARSIEARLSSLRRDHAIEDVVDVTDLLPKRSSRLAEIEPSCCTPF
jgi:tetratricopeptide (TPR) repeat protein